VGYGGSGFSIEGWGTMILCFCNKGEKNIEGVVMFEPGHSITMECEYTLYDALYRDTIDELPEHMRPIDGEWC